MMFSQRRWGYAAFGLAALVSCSSEEGPKSAGVGGGSSPGAGTSGVTSSAGTTGNAGTTGSAGNGVGGAAGNGGGGAASGGAPPDTGFDAKLNATALAANQSVGVEWNAVEGATAYRVYFSEGAAPTSASPRVEVAAPHASFVHRALTNGTPYHYAVSAIVGGMESRLSPEAEATPDGEWVLEELGDGQVTDLANDKILPRIPLEKRIHITLFAEGYLAADLTKFHSAADHDGKRSGDVDAWVDYVLDLPPYRDFRDAFVVWYLARPSTTHFDGADTAFAVPVTASGTGSVSGNGETATRTWQALGLLPVPPTDFSGSGFGNARTHVAAFLMLDAARGRAGISGLTLALRNPAQTSQRIATAFGVGHAHEFTHAFSSLRDEYIELDNSAPTNTSETSNVVGSNQCSTLPWQHLLSGGTFNAATDELVGAFGTPEQGYHSELICLLNGTHDNATHYGGNGLLRADDRMCNFCREITAYRIYSRAGVLSDDAAGFSGWKTAYRAKFFERFPFEAPAVVPQTNNVQNPAQGMAYYEACTATAQQSASARLESSGGRHGCVVDE